VRSYSQDAGRPHGSAEECSVSDDAHPLANKTSRTGRQTPKTIKIFLMKIKMAAAITFVKLSF
jgi:hypothetical protein